MGNKYYFEIAIVGFLLGVALALIFGTGTVPLIVFSVSSLILLLFFFEKKILYIFLIALVLGFIRVDLIEETPFIERVENGTVITEIEEGESHAQYVLKTGEGKVLFVEKLPTIVEYESQISVDEETSPPKDFITNSGRIFDYQNYLKRDKIGSLVFVDEVTVLPKSEDKWSIRDALYSVRGVLYSVRNSFLDNLNKAIPNPEANLLAGILLGVKAALGDHLEEVFIATGLIHIVVLSGYNITIVSDAVRRSFGFLRKNWQLNLSIIFIILFVIMVGAEVPAVRAGLMAIIAIIALQLNRIYLATRTLILIFTLFVIFKPYSLFYDVSLHLSVLATYGLLVLSPYIAEKLNTITDKFSIRTIVATTVSTQIFILPYLSYQIGLVSIVGVLANLLVLPIIPFVMLTGTIVGLVSYVSETLANLLSPIATIPLSFILYVAEFLAGPEFAQIEIREFPIWLMFAMYLIYGFFIYKIYNRTSQ